MKNCRVTNCTDRVKAKDLCARHYQCFRKGSNMNTPKRLEKLGRCKIEKCKAKEDTKNLCGAHYQKLLKYGDPLFAQKRSPNKGATCEVKGCNRVHHGNGLCTMHLARWVRHNDTSKVSCVKTHGSTCELEGCEALYYCKGMCSTHYAQDYKSRLGPAAQERETSRRTSAIGRYKHLRKMALRRNLSMTLSLEDHVLLLSKVCTYCAQPLNASGCGLDRIEPSKGYESGNVVPCCKLCNQAKMDLSVQDFFNLIERIYLNAFQKR